MKHIGPPMRYGGSGLWVEAEVPGTGRGITFYKVEASSFELPSVIELGVGYHVGFGEQSELNLAGAFQNNNFAYDEWRVGAEYSYRDRLFLRGGYLIGAAASDETPLIFEDVTLGAGVNLETGGGLNVTVDYAFVPVEFFDSNHIVSIQLGF